MDKLSPNAIETLISAAVTAPSGDNTQPWRFEVDPDAARIAVWLDETRDPSPINCGQRMARIAVGAAVENILVTARYHDWPARLQPAPSGAMAMIEVEADETDRPDVAPVVKARVTNRRIYDGRPVPEEVLAELKAKTAPLDRLSTHWICDRDRIAAIAAVVANCDAVMFGQREMLHAFLSKVRFDAAPDAEVDDGLSLASIEAGVMERLALRFMHRAPHGLLKSLGVIRQLGKFARKLANSASGLCVVVAPDRHEQTDVLVGRAVQRAWLALAAHGLAAQPMMSGPVLENALEHGSRDLVDALGREQLQSLRDTLRAHVPECGAGRLAWIMRFGHAAEVSGRTGRLPWPSVTTETSLT